MSIIAEIPESVHGLMQPIAEQEGWDTLVCKALLRYYFDVIVAGKGRRDSDD